MSDPIEPDDLLRPTGDGAADGPRGESCARNWLDERYPLVDADFVGSTLEKVLRDRSQIASEAARVDEIRCPQGFLDAWTVPAPSVTFVDATLSRVVAQRAADLHIRTEDDYELHLLLEHSVVPEPTPEFVESTLRAVFDSRVSRPRLVWRAPAGSGRRFAVVASVAAIVLCVLAVFWKSGADDTHRHGHRHEHRRPHPATPPAAISIAAPVAWASLVTESDVDEDPSEGTFPIRIEHPITLFARQVQIDRGGGR